MPKRGALGDHRTRFVCLSPCSVEVREFVFNVLPEFNWKPVSEMLTQSDCPKAEAKHIKIRIRIRGPCSMAGKFNGGLASTW